jgi:selenocysteine lyase/cysteine desulfurase
LFYVRRSLQAELAPVALGWRNVRCPNFAAQEEMILRPDAARYEAGSANLLGIVGLRAAMELLLEIGLPNIAAELLRKRAWLAPALQAKGFTVLHPGAPPAHASGIITFHRAGDDMAALYRKLASGGIVTSLRADRTGRQFIRLSPHFYNTDAELQRLLEAL